MKFKSQLLLGFGMLGILLGVYFADESFTAKKEQQKQENAVALYFDNKDCVKFSMQNAQGTFVFERENFQSPWVMVSPKQLVADQDSVNTTLVSLRNISVQRALGSDNNLDNYGLTTPALYFELTLKNKKTKTLSLGNNVNENTSRFQLPSVYAQAADRSNILVVDNSSIPSFVEKSYSDFRTKNVAHFNAADVKQIVIKQMSSVSAQPDIIELKHTNHSWTTTSPISTPANSTFVAQYLGALEELTAENIIETPAQNIQNALNSQGINLNSTLPNGSIVLKNADGKSLQELSLYMTKSGIFTNMSDGAFAQIDLEKWPDLLPKFKHFRNRSVMLGLNATCDSDLESLVAHDVLDDVTNVNLQKFGLQKPLKTFACAVNENQNKERVQTKKIDVFIGNRVPLDEKNVYIKRSDSNTVYIVSAEALSKLAESKPL